MRPLLLLTLATALACVPWVPPTGDGDGGEALDGGEVSLDGGTDGGTASGVDGGTSSGKDGGSAPGPFTVKEQFHAFQVNSSMELAIVLSSVTGTCADFEEYTAPKSSEWLQILVDMPSGDFVGDHRIEGIDPDASATLTRVDASCARTDTAAASGVVHLTSVDDNAGVQGSYDVVVSGKHLTGAIDTTRCAGFNPLNKVVCR